MKSPTIRKYVGCDDLPACTYVSPKGRKGTRMATVQIGSMKSDKWFCEWHATKKRRKGGR